VTTCWLVSVVLLRRCTRLRILVFFLTEDGLDGRRVRRVSRRQRRSEGEKAASGEATVDGDGVPVRGGQDDLEQRCVEGDDSLLLSPSDRRRGRRWAFFHSAWVGVDGDMLRLGGKVHDGACHKASLVLGLERCNQRMPFSDRFVDLSQPKGVLDVFLWSTPRWF
jgi:hypothetical protein